MPNDDKAERWYRGSNTGAAAIIFEKRRQKKTESRRKRLEITGQQ
jgi:hypothetical protein